MNRFLPIAIIGGLIGIGWFVFWLHPAAAQTVPVGISIYARPQSPSPGEPFTVTASPPLAERNSSYFRWRVNGVARPELSGYGKNKADFVAGDFESKTVVSVDITEPSGEVNSGTVVIPVSDLSLTWSADVYTPKWYEGKPLAAPRSTVRVAAIPEILLDGQIVPTERLVFTWLINSAVILTGPGEDVLEFEANKFSDTTYPVEVRIQDFQKRIFKYGFIRIILTDPEFVLYPFAPLGGIDPRASVNGSLEKERGVVDLELEPFFAMPKSKHDLIYSWTVAGFRVSGQPENPYLLSVDASKYAAGVVPISVAVEQAKEIYRYFSKNFILKIK